MKQKLEKEIHQRGIIEEQTKRMEQDFTKQIGEFNTKLQQMEAAVQEANSAKSLL